MEDNLCLAELESILQAARDRDYENQKFAASLKGINLDEQMNKHKTSKFEEIKNRVDRKIKGDNHDLKELGFEIEIEQD